MSAAAHALVLVLGGAASASAQSVDATIFGGLAFPLYNERFAVRNPSFPGVEVTDPSGTTPFG